MMVDVQYTWSDVDQALRTLRDWADLDVYFVETPLQIDDLGRLCPPAQRSADENRRRRMAEHAI